MWRQDGRHATTDSPFKFSWSCHIESQISNNDLIWPQTDLSSLLVGLTNCSIWFENKLQDPEVKGLDLDKLLQLFLWIPF